MKSGVLVMMMGALVLSAGCSTGTVASSPAFVTTSPTVAAAPTSAPTPAPTPTAPATAAPTPTPSPTATRPTATRTALVTATPTVPAFGDEIGLPGSLGLTRDEFVTRWNAATPDDSLRIDATGWQTQTTAQGELSQFFFSNPTDASYKTVAVGVLLNDDGSIRSASVVYAPSSDPSNHSYEQFLVIVAHQTLIDTVLPDGPSHTSQRDQVLYQLTPTTHDYTGVDAVTSANGVRFRLVDNGSGAILLISRQDNLGH